MMKRRRLFLHNGTSTVNGEYSNNNLVFFAQGIRTTSSSTDCPQLWVYIEAKVAYYLPPVPLWPKSRLLGGLVGGFARWLSDSPASLAFRSVPGAPRYAPGAQ